MPYADPEKERASQKLRSAKYRAKKRAERFGSDAPDMRGRHGNHARGPNNARWNDGKIISEEGYVKLRVGKNHPLADPNGYAYEHLVIWAAAGNPLPASDELLHHRDENKRNNRLENLERITRSGHATHHNRERGRNDMGQFRSADGREWNELPEVAR